MVGKLPSTYLGLPLGAKYKSVRVWDPVVERFEKRLAGWKSRYLSKGGKLTLIKSTLSNLPIYYMSLFVMPASVKNKLEKIMRRFLWSGKGEDNSYALVRWDLVKQPRELGGLGIKSLDIMNKALLGKWLWRYGSDLEGHWKELLKWKYGEGRGNWCTNEAKGPFGVGVWKGILKVKDMFIRCVGYKVGDGTRVLFWHDVWCGDEPLKNVFPNLFLIAMDDRGTVADSIEWMGDSCVWTPLFRRNLRDEEVSGLIRLLRMIERTKASRNEVDSLLWKGGGGATFSVKNLYKYLSIPTTQGDIKFPVKAIWGKEVLPRVSFFAWTAYYERILTSDNLQVKGWQVVNRCFMCKSSGESTSHLLLHCGFARGVWNMFFALLGICWVMPESISSFVKSWNFPGMRGRKKIFWKITPLITFWLIWKERNRRVFDDVEEDVVKVKSRILLTFFGWIKVIDSCVGLTYEEFLDSFSLSA